jgi:putative chitinase
MIDKARFIDLYKPRPVNEVAMTTMAAIIDHYNNDDKLTCKRQLAYILATAFHESAGSWNPGIKEFGRGKNKKYGQRHNQTGQYYYGRGLCQLTWHFNYVAFSEILGIDLVNNPDLALEPENSVKILIIGMRDGIFTKRKLNMYFDEDTTDWEGARRIVNGMDKARLIAKIAMSYNNNLIDV